jgi:hypothetical protein
MPSPRRPRFGVLLFVCLATAALAGACGNSGNNSGFQPGSTNDASSGGSGDAGSDGPGLLGGDGAPPNGTLTITPNNLKVAVPYGTHAPTVTFKAAAGGVSVPASFSIDLGQIGVIDPGTGVLTPSGKTGGIANVTATFGGQKATTKVTVTVQMTENGAPAGYDGGGGVGGNGGVGGSGPGGQVGPSGQMVLSGTPMADAGLSWLYPYDKTVWPQGLLAPLLQWQPGAVGNYDAIYIHLVENGFEYKGFFSNPATPFVNHPILQPAWDTLSYSNQGEPVTVTLVFSSGGVAYGPLTETWNIAQGTLTGTVYYNSYGTSLVTNYCAATSWSSGQYCFGGATLGIKRGATSPILVAGSNSPMGDQTGCRVCHSVAAQGATLITQHGDNYAESSAYALTGGNAETAMTPANSQFAFPAISPDGTYLFTNTGALPGDSPPATSGLFAIPSGATIASTGLPPGLGAATPTFSPDGTHIAFNDYSSMPATGALASIDFTPATKTFANLQTLDTPPAGVQDIFPAFLPTNDAVIFERELSGTFGATSGGTTGELWWVDLKTHTAAKLTTLNGGTYLPTSTIHMADTTLQYEPTVNPVASGGYAWVVFTSRRLYGNVATQDPFLSDPRSYNPALSATTKKLWVAAIDLNAKPGTDPSHPAFYLPAQELLAGNSRGYWVVDPCEQNGQSCLTGDQCCSGYCGASDGGALVCGMAPPGCSSVSNKCTTNTDCCGSSTGIECIDGFCAQPTPQ